MSNDRFLEQYSDEKFEIAYEHHPAFATLLGYAMGELTGEDEAMAEGVALHIATCRQCFTEVKQIRVEMSQLTRNLPRMLPSPLRAARRTGLSQTPTKRFLDWIQKNFSGWLATKPAFYRHAIAFMAISTLLVLINYWLNSTELTLASQGILEWWALWFVVPWGCLLLIHAVLALLKDR